MLSSNNVLQPSEDHHHHHHHDEDFEIPGLMSTVSKEVLLEDNDEVKALAARLAPQVEQLDALLAHPVPESSTLSASPHEPKGSNDEDDDDDLGAEMEHLNISAQLLRQELEFAHDFGSWLSRSAETTPQHSTDGTEGKPQQQQATPRRELFPLSVELEMDSEGPADDIFPIPTPEPHKETPLQASSNSKTMPPKSSRLYSLQDHAKALGITTEPRGGWYLLDVSTYYCQEARQFDSDPVVQEYCLPLPVKDLQRLYVGSCDLFQGGGSLPRRESFNNSSSSVGVVEESPLTSPASEWTTSTTNTTTTATLSSSPGRTSHSFAAARKPLDALPVRTTAIRIRPDVLCGAVMDALHHALQNLQNAEVWKRQGGHILAIVGGSVTTNRSNTNPSSVALPPYVVHAQLCTHKSNDIGGRRILLLQTYHVTSAAAASTAANGPADWTIPPSKIMKADEEEDDDISNDHVDDDDDDDDTERDTTNMHMMEHLKEACALIQRMETTPPEKHQASLSPIIPKLGSSPPSKFSWLSNNNNNNQGNAQPLGGVFGSPASMRQAVSEHLLQHLHPCPSVQDGGLTLPALSSTDWPVIVSSSRWLATAFEELETRDLTYNTLRHARFGAFPALPTLDVHYCSQMRRLSRERMILQLLHSASQLEEFAREAEYACANLISMLQPMFESYDMEPPALPQPVPLTAYPLNFVAPQAACPPWGFKVMEALNTVSATTSDANTKQRHTHTSFSQPSTESSLEAKQSFQMAQEAVDMVYEAFTKQDDEERSARLGRKNAQVLDRLSKMQAHQLACLYALRDGDTHKALAAANDFFAKAQLANNHLEASPQVPLLKSSIVAGSSTGTCYVTATHLLLVTQLIPYLGGTKATLLNLQDVKFRLQDHSNEKSSSSTSPPQLSSLLLLQRPPASIAIIDVQTRRTVMTFRPAIAAARFYRVLEVIRAAAFPKISQPFGGPMDHDASASSLAL